MELVFGTAQAESLKQQKASRGGIKKMYFLSCIFLEFRLFICSGLKNKAKVEDKKCHDKTM